MTPLPHLAVIEVNGADAARFLHDQLSNDVLALDDGAALTACYCNPQGRVLDHLLVGRDGERFLLVLQRHRSDDFLARIRMFVLRSQVHFTPLDDYTVSGVDGDGIVGKSCFEGAAGLRYVIGGAGPETAGKTEVDAWTARELQAGMLWLGPETSGRFLPQMLGFDNLGSVNFRKGCYPGQEVVARSRYLGRVKRLPMLLWLQGPANLDPNQSVQLHANGNESSSATLVASATPPDGGVVAVVVVRDRDTLAPTGLDGGEGVVAVQRWATI